jgi:Protein of unknown function (DUF429)
VSDVARECIAVDWSGAVSGASAHIWWARAVGGELQELVAPGSREAVGVLLHERLLDNAPCVVGLDFAFSVPAWFADARGWRDVNAIWDAAAEHGERWMRECDPPFWGRAGKRRPHEVERGLRETEQHWGSGQRPKSVFQIGGAGAVGTGSLRGMPLLRQLRRAGWSVWPFDASGSHTICEIYPRLFTGAVIKRSAEARSAYLTQAALAITTAQRDAMCASEDAFDAGVSALVMSRVDAAPLPRSTDAVSAIEGAIWVPNLHDTQRAAHRTTS